MKLIVATLFSICNVQAADEPKTDAPTPPTDVDKSRLAEAVGCMMLTNPTEMTACA